VDPGGGEAEDLVEAGAEDLAGDGDGLYHRIHLIFTIKTKTKRR